MDTLTDRQVREITDRMESLLTEPASEPVTRVGSKVMPTTPVAPAPAPYIPQPARPAAIVGAPAAQGDLLFMPSRREMPHWTQPLHQPLDLISEGNGHRMDPTGRVRYAPLNGGIHGSDHVIGVLDIGPDATCLIGQPRGRDRHQPLVLGPGLWEIRRQTEQVGPRRVRITFD